MLSNYLPVLIFMIIAFVMAGVVIGLGFVLGPRRYDSEKLSPYECGFEAFEDSRSGQLKLRCLRPPFQIK